MTYEKLFVSIAICVIIALLLLLYIAGKENKSQQRFIKIQQAEIQRLNKALEDTDAEETQIARDFLDFLPIDEALKTVDIYYEAEKGLLVSALKREHAARQARGEECTKK